MEDSNDNAPEFARPVFVSQLSTEAVRGQFVSRALAWDPDGGRLQYSVLPHALHHIFSVEPDTGTSHFYIVEKFSSAKFFRKKSSLYCVNIRCTYLPIIMQDVSKRWTQFQPINCIWLIYDRVEKYDLSALINISAAYVSVHNP